MIAVIGDLLDRPPLPGLATAVALRVAKRGGDVQVVGAVPADAGGDRRLVALAAAGVGHAAVSRSPAAALEPADLELALRYLPDLRVLVLVGVPDGLLATATAAASYAGAAIVALADGDAGAPLLPADALVLGAPATDPDGAFAGLAAELAVRLDAGTAPAAAWSETLRAVGVDAPVRR